MFSTFAVKATVNPVSSGLRSRVLLSVVLASPLTSPTAIALIGSTHLSARPDLAMKAGNETNEPPGKYVYEIYSCRSKYGFGSSKRKCLNPSEHNGDDACPRRAPRAYSKTFKYPESYTNSPKIAFCSNAEPSEENNYKGGTPIARFCQNDILQLRLDVPKHVSNQTAIEVNWGITNDPVPFFCPARFSSYEPAHGLHNYCLSQVCRQKYAIRPGDTERTSGTFYEVDNTWYLNLKLRENAGHWGLAMRVFSCPSQAAPMCELYHREAACQSCIETNTCCKDDKFQNTTDCADSVRPQCCLYENNLDLRMVDYERNDFLSPATYIGQGLYSMTIIKSDAYDSLNITDALTGDSVEDIATDFGPEKINVTLLQGIYQVSGTTNHYCGAAELSSPIVLLPVKAKLNPPEYVDLPLRKVSWTTNTSIPVIRYTLQRQEDESAVNSTTQQAVLLHIGGEKHQTPAPLRQTFVHRIDYEGVAENNGTEQAFTISLEEFQPIQLVVSHNGNQIWLQWQRPKNYTQLNEFLLHVDKTSINPESSFTIRFDGTQNQYYSYSVIHPFPAEESVRFRLAGVYKNTANDVSWWGPETTQLLTITKTTALVTPTALTSSLMTPSTTPASSLSGSGLTIVLASSLAAAVVVAVTTIGTVVTICYCIKKEKNRIYQLDDPVSDPTI